MESMEEGLAIALAELGKLSLEYEKQSHMEYKDLYLSTPKEALAYFLTPLFYRGRFDWLSEIYAKEAVSRVRKFIESQGWREPDESRDELGLSKPVMDSGYKFPKADQRMVYGAVRLTIKVPSKNVVFEAKSSIESKAARKIYDRIVEIPYVKDKLTCLFLRDLASLYDLIDKVTEDVDLFLPIDTWVRQYCERLKIASASTSNEEIKQKMIETCNSFTQHVPVICFDHGLWVTSQLQYFVHNFDFLGSVRSQLGVVAKSELI